MKYAMLSALTYRIFNTLRELISVYTYGTFDMHVCVLWSAFVHANELALI